MDVPNNHDGFFACPLEKSQKTTLWKVEGSLKKGDWMNRLSATSQSRVSSLPLKPADEAAFTFSVVDSEWETSVFHCSVRFGVNAV